MATPQLSPEAPAARATRRVIGVLLLLESVGAFIMACFSAIVGSLATMLAVGAGAGGSSGKQLAQGFTVVALTLSVPFLVAGVLAATGILILLRRGRSWAIAGSLVGLAAQAAFHLYFDNTVYPAEVFLVALQLVALGVAARS